MAGPRAPRGQIITDIWYMLILARQNEIDPKIFSAVTPHDTAIPLDSGTQRISCSVAGLSGAANVKWYNPSGSEITSGQGSYTIIDGKSSYTTGSQTTFLEIGTPVLQAMTTIETYKCGITSGVSTTSAESKSDVVVTPVGQLSTKVEE